ncbi:hypothetical protein Q7C36_017698 [Tachysurus vachellii]|uniref:Uncharacterized protein n=1 Tax=Tachysurus vachellii TaxID=175792 RepID=A0AA88M422_TACVA|nr:hypothetical protein Q7C36_017698 [Tachysurus vachellii]
MGTSSKSVTLPRTSPPLHLVLIYSYLCNNATWRLSTRYRPCTHGPRLELTQGVRKADIDPRLMRITTTVRL